MLRCSYRRAREWTLPGFVNDPNRDDPDVAHFGLAIARRVSYTVEHFAVQVARSQCWSGEKLLRFFRPLIWVIVVGDNLSYFWLTSPRNADRGER